MSLIDVATLTRRRIADPAAVDAAWAARRRGSIPSDGRLLLIAADHPARGALSVRGTVAMASRSNLLERLAVALSRPGVNGVLGTPDILEDLLLAGLLDGAVVVGSMNRGGIQGAVFEFDDRFTAYDSRTLVSNGLDGGKMLVRICMDDAGTARTLETAGNAVTELARQGLMAIVEPFLSVRTTRGHVQNLLDADSVITAVQIASGLGASSARTWLKIPVVPDMERALDATTLPTLLLGGDPTGTPKETYRTWAKALGHSSAAGLVVGRALLFPADGDIATAVDVAADLVHGGS